MAPECNELSPTLLLDLDGTLVDSVPDLTASLNRLMAARGIPPFTEAEVTPLVGDGAAVLVARALALRGTPDDGTALPTLLADYTAHAAEATRPYPGVVDGLHALAAAGWRLAVCTNKPERAARVLLDALGLDGFAAVGGGDSFPVRKPDPGHLLATLAAAGGRPGAAIMVGDHHNDVAAAAGAGLPCIFAAWGYGPRTMAAGAAAIAESFAEIPALARRLLPG